MSMPIEGIVVPHTHWDRAWYLPFQAYRLRLVDVMAELLGLLESNALPLFVLDGQTVVLEDHLAIRPQDRPRIQRLAAAGRIRLGPWYTMPDCFLARPESLIRNLARGLAMAGEIGGVSRVGYVPDSFGHFAQLPQILAGFGIDSFFFMRGMPAELRDEHGAVFTWRAPDGSEVVATFLREGYFPLGALGQESFHGRYDGLPASLPRAEDRLGQTLARVLPYQRRPVVVLPAGGDHLPARGDLALLLDHLNATRSDIRLRFGAFEDYLERLRGAAPQDAFPVHEGDLLGQADHPLLRNVLSSRVDLKILNHHAQSLLTRVVEPLLAWSSAQGLPVVDQAVIESAWDALLKNHAHDDICGCSVDDVHLDDVQRFHEVLALGGEIITRQLEHVVRHHAPPAAEPRTTRVFAFNPHPWPVEVSADVRLLFADEGGEFSAASASRGLRATTADGTAVPVQVLATACKALRSRYLETTWGRSYDVHATFRLPPLGFDVLTISETSEPLHLAVNERPDPIPESLVRAIRFELDADLGDGYSHGPCPEIPTRHARLVSAKADARLPGVFHLEYEIAGHAWVRRDDLAAKSLGECLGPEATMPISVRGQRRGDGTTFVWDLSITYTNIFSDSRLRLVVDPEAVAGADGLGACRDVIVDGQAQWVAVPARSAVRELWDGPLATPAYPGEKPYPVQHTNDGLVWQGTAASVCCGGAGLHEFELVPSASGGVPAAALTLHRAVGFLSVRGGRIRSCQAGPQRPTPAAQLQQRLEHTVAVGRADDLVAAMRLLKQTLHPCWIQELPVVPIPATAGPALAAATVLDVGDTPLELMCMKPAAGGGILVRLLNPTAGPVDVPLPLGGLGDRPLRAVRTTLDESTTLDARDLAPRQPLRLSLEPFAIHTWTITPC